MKIHDTIMTMMRLKIKSLIKTQLLAGFLLLPLLCVNGQNRKSEMLNDEISVALSSYLEKVEFNSPLYIGRNQKLPPIMARGGMYLRPKGFREYDIWGNEIFTPQSPSRDSYGEGQLMYNGILYPSVQLRLDLVTDELIILASDKIHSLVLDEKRVDYASFFDYKIVYLLDNYSITNGYYLELHSGIYPIYKKSTSKYLLQENSYTRLQNKYYINIASGYHQVKNKAGILNLFKTHKKELESFIKTNDLKFKDNFETDIVLVVEEYEKLARK